MSRPSQYPCQLVNPLCPDDLCVLPRGHGGNHQLGTMVEPDRLTRWIHPPKGRRLLTREELIRLGDEEQASWLKEEHP